MYYIYIYIHTNIYMYIIYIHYKFVQHFEIDLFLNTQLYVTYVYFEQHNIVLYTIYGEVM